MSDFLFSHGVVKYICDGGLKFTLRDKKQEQIVVGVSGAYNFADQSKKENTELKFALLFPPFPILLPILFYHSFI